MYVGPHNNWLTLGEVAALLTAAELSIDSMVKNPTKVRPVMIQGAQHWKEDDVQAYITEHRTTQLKR